MKQLDRKIENYASPHNSKSQSTGPGSDGEVVELDEAAFEDLVMNSQDKWLINLYEELCKHCEAFTPEYRKAAINLKGRVKFGRINGPKHQSFAKRFGVNWYPGVIGFGRGAKTEAAAVRYDMRGRSAEDLMAFASDMKRF